MAARTPAKVTNGANATREQQHAAMEHYGEKLAANPSGLLVYHPPGAKALTTGQLVTEFLTEVVEALIVVFLLAQTRLTSFGSRVGVCRPAKCASS